VISEVEAEELWRVLERRNTDRLRFDVPHVFYYFGALVLISAMTWFMTLGWERFSGGGILAISRSYALGFMVAGGLLWRDNGLKVPDGLLVTAAVCMTPLGVGVRRAWEIFEGSLPFPFVLSTAGLAIIALGIFYTKNRDRIEGTVVRAVPTGIGRLDQPVSFSRSGRQRTRSRCRRWSGST
jgi:hypothetical protein